VEALTHRQVHGWLVQFVTPMRQYRPGGDSFSFTWAITNTHWVYADTYGEAIAKGRSWAEAVHVEAREESGPQ
jgi:hypothetical protein